MLAVNNLSFELFAEETLSIVGESGSGKSTTGKAILNILKLTAPEVVITGQILLKTQRGFVDLLTCPKKQLHNFRSQLQMIFQDPFSSLNPRMIVKDIIQEPLDINEPTLSKKEKEEKVNWLLDKVGLDQEQAYRYPYEFSGGQRQRIGIARSLATNPKIIIADEPVSALDVSIQAQVINLLLDLQEEFKLSIIFIAHDLSVVKFISHRALVMNQGKCVEQGPIDQIFDAPKHTYTKCLLASIPQPNPNKRDQRKAERKKYFSEVFHK